MQHNAHVIQRRVYRVLHPAWLIVKWTAITALTFIAVVAAVVHSFERMESHRKHHH